ncbi:MAG: hypothetical protein RIT28_3493 [Pseudomonadota bacterium]
MVFFAALLGCQSPDGALRSVDVQLGETIPNVLEARYEADAVGESWVRWGYSEDALVHETKHRAMSPGAMEHLVVGPASGRTVFVQLVTAPDGGDDETSAVLSLDVPVAPAGLPRLYAEGTPGDEGLLLTTILSLNSGWVILANAEGEVAWTMPLAFQEISSSVQVSRDGEALMVLLQDAFDNDTGTELLRVGWDGVLIDRTKLPDGHHDFVELADGRIAWIQDETITMEINGQQRSVIGDAIQVTKQGGEAQQDAEPIFSLFDYYTPSVTCQHQETPVSWQDDTAVDWSHINSLTYDAESDRFFAMSHYTDSVYVISASDGALIDDINPYGDYRMVMGGKEWSHPHSSWMRDGELLVFDNGMHHEPQVSRVARYTYDDERQEMTQTWEYNHPNNGFAVALGDAHPTPSGNILIAWSPFGQIAEVNDAKEVVWTLETEAGAGIGRARWLQDLP